MVETENDNEADENVTIKAESQEMTEDIYDPEEGLLYSCVSSKVLI